MKKTFPIVILFSITVLFFYKTFFFFQIPFPADLLISEYAPWKFEKYLGYNPGSYPNKAQYFDVIRQLYPWKMLVVSEIKKGKFPLWNPYNFSGSPLLANNQSAVFDPFNIVFFILSPSIAWTIFIMIQPFLACIFMYIYLRQIKLTNQASLLGSVSYGFSLFMSTFLEYGNFGHTIMWLPLTLFIIEKINDNTKDFYKYLFPFILSFIIFSGHLQLAFGSLIFILFYIIFKSNKKRLLVVLFLLGIGICSVQLIPSIELIVNSARESHTIRVISQNFLLQIHQLILFISPDTYGNPATRNYLLTDTYPGNSIYVGVVTFIFSLYAVLKFRQNRYARYFFCVILILLILLTNNPISYLFYSLKLPILSTSSPSNFIYLLSFSLCTLGAIGLSIWQRNKSLEIFKILIVAFIFFLILVGMHEVMNVLYLSKQMLVGFGMLIITGIVIIVANYTNRRLVLYLFLAITCIELFYYFQKFNPFVSQELIYPQTKIEKYLQKNEGFDRFWGVGQANIEANFSTNFRTYSPEGYDPLYPKWYAKMFSEDGKTLFSARSDAKLVQTNSNNSISQNNKRYETINQLGVKYILDRIENGSSETTFPPSQFQKIYESNGWKVMKNINAWPRAFTIPIGCLDHMNINECSNRNIRSMAKILKYEPDEVIIKNGSKLGYLILSDTYYPGWKAFINKHEREVIKLDNGLRGIKDVAANQVVKFIYKPDSFKWGLIASIISMIAAICYITINY